MIRPKRSCVHALVVTSRLAVLTAALVVIGTATDVTANRVTALELREWEGRPIGALDSDVFALALRAASCAVSSGAVSNLSTLTVIDYSRPSTAERFWVFDLRTQALLYEELVAHGQGSGDRIASKFSNEEGSHQSSIGLFATGETYVGSNGYSLRLRGLDTGFNDKALERAIVMHGAPYVSEEFARLNGRIGRSWGCPALDELVAREIIETVKGSGLVFAYYPDSDWLSASKFLSGCSQ